MIILNIHYFKAVIGFLSLSTLLKTTPLTSSFTRMSFSELNGDTNFKKPRPSYSISQNIDIV